MRDDDMDLELLLGALPQSHSDALRAERVRTRCHRVLARARARTQSVDTGTPLRSRPLEAALVGGFGLVYLCAVALFALKSHGVL